MKSKLEQFEEDWEIETPPRGVQARVKLIAQNMYGDDYIMKGPPYQVLQSMWNEVYEY